MAIPNTTPTPNELFNGEMAKMSDTELRIVLVVTRATLGWEIDHKTGMRKQEDWISFFQLKQKTGRGYTALSQAIDNCIKNGWIEARDKNGNLLNTKQKRYGKRIFYRLGRIFLDKIDVNNKKETFSESEKVDTTFSESEISESEISESEAYKRNTITKEILIQNTASSNADAVNINPLIDLFKSVNPSYEKLYANKTQRAALKRLVDKWGVEKIKSIIEVLPKTNIQKYAPVITTPLQLENKIGQLIAFIQKQRSDRVIGIAI